ncbi:hypothetical protein VTH06DRAFT_3425 [Thermothelomyces fergusii]
MRSDEIRRGAFEIDQLMEEPTVKSLLGTVEQIASSDSQSFMDQLRKYIDSKEKTPGRKKEVDALEFWPLIKVVKIFVRSPILESGLVLVDLPGVHDSNAARSAVASKYIEECSGLWIVAPITRAVDDKVARNLLGDSFKRQMQLDGSYSNIAVVCSKADDISVTEILKTLGDEEEATKLNARVQILEPERDKLQDEVDALKGRLSEVINETENLRTEIDALHRAMDCSDDEDELIVFSPANSRKRPSRHAALEGRKRIRNLQRSESEDSDSG